MIKKILKYIPHAFAVILSIIVVIGFINYRGLKRDAQEYRERMLEYSEMYKSENAAAIKMSEEFSKLKTENKALNKEIRKQGETIQNLTKLNASIKDSIENIDTVSDTVYSVPIQRFDVSKGNFTIRGYFEIISPYRISFEEIKAKIQLEIAMTQNKNLVWRSYVTSPNPSFIVSDIQTSVKPYKPGFWEKLKFGAGVYASSNRVGGIAGVYYGNLGINLLLDNNGAAVGAQYLFGIKK